MLMLLAFFASCSFYYWPVTEARIPGRFERMPSSGEQSYLNEEQERTAVYIIKRSGIVERMNGGQDWSPVFRFPTAANALPGENAVRIEVTWDTPLDGSGPWALIHCQGTRKVVHTQRWSRITSLVTWVDLEAKLVVAYGVTSRPSDVPQPIIGPVSSFSLTRVYDVESGDLLIVGPYILIPPLPVMCPPGTYYWD